MLSLLDFDLVDLRQTIDVVMVTLDTEILCQVDDLDILRDGMFFQESFTLAVTKAEKDDIHLVERHLVGKPQISLADESFVHIADEIACVALRVGKHNLCL